MKMPQFQSTVRGRLVLLAMCVELVMLSVLVLNSIRLMHGAMTDQVLWHAAEIAPVLNAALTAPLAQQDSATVQAVLDESRANEGIDYAVVVDRSGTRVASIGWPADHPLPRPTDQSELSAARNLTRYDLVVPIALKTQLLGTLHFGLDLHMIAVAKRSLAVQSAVIAVSELLLSFLVLTIIGYWLTRHLKALALVSQQVTAGNLTPEPMREGNDDVGQMGAAFNTMSRAVADRIRELTEARNTAEKSVIATRGLNRLIENQKSLLDATIQSTTDLIFYKDLQGTYLGCNRAFAAYVGRPSSEIKDSTDDQLFSREIADFFREQDRLMLIQGEARSNEEWLDYPDGTRRLVETKKSPLRDSDGELLGLIGVARDVTARREAEERLRASETNFRHFFDALQDMIMVATREGRVLYTNSALAQKLGYSQEELNNIGILDIHPADRRQEAEETFTAMFQNGQDTCHLPLQHKDGTLVPAETRVSLGQWNGLDCIFCVSRDLSSEQEAQKRFEWLFRHTPALMMLFSLSDNYIVDVNDAFLMAMGYNREEVIGKSTSSFGPLRELEQKLTANGYPATGPSNKSVELIIHSKNGSALDVSFSGNVFSSNNDQYFLMVMVDITSLRMVEKELRKTNHNLEAATKRAQAENKAKGCFLATMSHEIRTPMAGVLGMVELLMKTTLTERQRHYTERIAISAETLLAVINDILDFSKIESGVLDLTENPFSLKEEVVDKAVTIIRLQAEMKGLALHVAIDDGIPLILGDPQRLTQVLVNLLGNAIKFTKKGEVGLTVQIRKRDRERVSLAIAIRDTGIGITREALPLLFKEFSQVAASGPHQYGGSGLGLAISKHMTELMGGEIVVESEFGQGSVFTVLLSLPVAPASIASDGTEKSAEIEESKGVHFAGVRVLVVEDHPINQEIAVEMLHAIGIDADIAGHGGEAVEKVLTGEYNLVLMDIQMPVMDGYQATQKIRNLGQGGKKHLPIVGMTAHAIAGDREKGLSAGMDDYLVKPIDKGALQKVLLTWLPLEARMTAPTPQGDGASAADGIATGLDVDEGLRRASGNRGLYLKLLKDFVEEFGNVQEEIVKNLRENQLEETIRRVHTIKGVSGNLGGKDLMTAAQVLEERLREMDNYVHFSIGGPLRDFIDRTQELRTAIAKVLAQQPRTTPVRTEHPEGTPEELRLLLERLQVALAAGEPRPSKEILELLAQRSWPENVEIILLEVCRLVDRYRLAEAYELLDKNNTGLPGKNSEGGCENG